MYEGESNKSLKSATYIRIESNVFLEESRLFGSAGTFALSEKEIMTKNIPLVIPICNQQCKTKNKIRFSFHSPTHLTLL